VALTIAGTISVMATSGYSPRSAPTAAFLPAIMLLCMPYVWGWILAPNKELLVGAAVVTIMHLLERKKMGWALFVALLAASIKVQFLYALLLYICTVRLPYRKTACLIGISLTLPIVLLFYKGLTAQQFLENVNGVDTVRTAWLFSALDNIAAYPLGFVIVGPIRFAANCFGGLNPARLLQSTSVGGALAPATSMVLGLLCAAFLVFKWRAMLNALMSRHTPAWHFCYSFAVVSCLVPYLQPRYFWWLIPMIVVGLILPDSRTPVLAGSGSNHAPEASSRVS
jgi:hypothetical protein